MVKPDLDPTEILVTARRFATLSEPASTDFSVDFLRSSFFNPSKINRSARNSHMQNEVLGAQSKPDVLAREVFRSMGIDIDPGAEAYLHQQAEELTVQATRGNQRVVQQIVASNVPRNAMVRRGFENLQQYLDESFGIMYDHLALAASTFGNFVVAQAVMDAQAGMEADIDLRDPQQNKVS